MGTEVHDSIGGSILEEVRSRFHRSRPTPFGVDHALKVAGKVERLLTEPEYESMNPTDVLCARAAALLHDIGFSELRDDWSPACEEHVDVGAEVTCEILGRVPTFSTDSQLIARVAHLVRRHESTAYSYPWASLGGQPVQKRDPAQERDDLALALLKEADGLSHISGDLVEIQSEKWLDEGVPRVPSSSPLTTWMWGESVVGNLRLLGKRAVVDARSTSGTQEALEGYRDLERLVRYHCSLADSLYEAEACTPDWREQSLERGGGEKPGLKIHRFHPWRSLEERLRSCYLLHDRSIHPYRHARIRTQLVDIDDLSPLALYVVKRRLDEVLELHDVLMSQYCLGLWDLPGLVEYSYRLPDEQLLAPPVLERYTETAWDGHPLVIGLMDGLHRCWQARSLGLAKVRAVVITEVPYPPLPLPTSWGEVCVVEKPPEKSKRRNLRYKREEDYPASFKTTTRITKENVEYFLYRDLSSIGSRGPRGRRPFADDNAG